MLRHATPKERKQIEDLFPTLPLLNTPATIWRGATSLGDKSAAITDPADIAQVAEEFLFSVLRSGYRAV